MRASDAGSRCDQVIVFLDFVTPGGRSALDPGLFSLTHSGSTGRGRGKEILMNDVDRYDFLKTLAEACQKHPGK